MVTEGLVRFGQVARIVDEVRGILPQEGEQKVMMLTCIYVSLSSPR